MTAQINDQVFHRLIRWNVAGISGVGLFDPLTCGLRLAPVSSGCWRGFYTKYAVRSGRLVLSSLTVFLDQSEILKVREGRAPTIGGVYPRAVGLPFLKAATSPVYRYSGLKRQVDFTGGVLLGKGFIKALYVHMGFHPAWKYRNVRELLFEGGRLVEDIDRSASMEDVRKSAAAGESMRPADAKHIGEWVKDCFSRDYTRWP